MMQLSLEEGRTLKQEGLDRVAEANTAFLLKMRYKAMRISRERGWVSSDDLRAYASQLDLAPTHQNAWGAIFKGPHWKIIGRRKSAVPESHGREIKVWAYTPQSGT